MNPFKHLTLTLLGAAALAASMAAHGAVVSGLRDHFQSLGGVYAAQLASNPWTFHTGSHAGALLTAGADRYTGPVSPQQIGWLLDTGNLGCTPGFCGGVVPADTLATFDGVFVHSGSPEATVAVFHAEQAMQLDQIDLFSEMVQNGHVGDGMTVQVLAIIGGLAQDIGQFDMTHALSTTSAIHTVYTPGLALGAGDLVEVRYGPRSNYLYDHGNVDIRITTSDITTGPQNVPEPQTLALAGLGLLAAVVARRRRR
jgi:hypothetical protein